ncbi:MAG: (d)CMP kinase [Lachnospiraceae bacterium]|nr:(d)CMP kinase [Lachnospiraceae bacterium]
MIRSIAIDGPAGAGKSTIAKKIAKQKGFIYVDTGAMYRAMGLYYMNKGVSPEDTEKIEGLINDIDVSISYENGEQVVSLNGENVNSKIRTPEVGSMASEVSTNGAVRKKMVSLQQQLAKTRSVVMDGRDIGTVVLPDAMVKIFLTASVDIRTKRRFDELKEKGIECDFEKLKKEIEDRDYRDIHRDNSPLKKADDAVEVDTSELNVDEVVKKILDIAESKGL